MALQFAQIVYWLALATWFGGAMFIAVGWRVVFKSVDEAKPILPHVLSVNLEGQHGTLLAGTIVGNMLAAFLRVELGCCAALVVSLAGEAMILNLHDAATLTSIAVRGVLLMGATGVVVCDWRLVWPRLWRYRQEFLDHADEPEKANPAKDKFDQYQRQSVTLLQVMLFLLLGMVLFSVAAAPTPVPQTAQPQIAQPETVHAAAPQ